MRSKKTIGSGVVSGADIARLLVNDMSKELRYHEGESNLAAIDRVKMMRMMRMMRMISAKKGTSGSIQICWLGTETFRGPFLLILTSTTANEQNA